MRYSANSELHVTTGLESVSRPGARLRNSVTEVLSSQLIWLYPVFAGVLLLLFTVGKQAGIPFSVFTQDPLVVANGQPYFGLLSNVGILFWCAAAAICIFTCFVLRKSDHRRFFFASGLLTMVLLLDDLFQLHEKILPATLGIRQRYILLAYLLITAVYLVTYRKIILKSFGVFMVAALTLFTVSMVEDAASLISRIGPPSWHYLVEDGAKLFGIISWFSFFACFAQKEIRSCIDPNN